MNPSDVPLAIDAAGVQRRTSLIICSLFWQSVKFLSGYFLFAMVVSLVLSTYIDYIGKCQVRKWNKYVSGKRICVMVHVFLVIYHYIPLIKCHQEDVILFFIECVVCR